MAILTRFVFFSQTELAIIPMCASSNYCFLQHRHEALQMLMSEEIRSRKAEVEMTCADVN